MRLVSWNVNGIRSILQKNFYTVLKEYSPDLMCLQEIKARPEQVEFNSMSYHEFWNPAQKAGYSGTLVLSKTKPLNYNFGLGAYLKDSEGRVVTLEFPDYYIVNVYTPNAQKTLTRLSYRYSSWDPQFCKYLVDLKAKKPLIICGDLNVARHPIDLARPKENEGKPGFTAEERYGLENLIDLDLVDTFRLFHPEPNRYSWWSYRTAARSRNIGWRIDYILASSELQTQMQNADILDHILGSDHCPVLLDLKTS